MKTEVNGEWMKMKMGVIEEMWWHGGWGKRLVQFYF